MSAKIYMVIAKDRSAGTPTFGVHEDRFSKTEAQRLASELLESPSIVSCIIVSEVMVVKK